MTRRDPGTLPPDIAARLQHGKWFIPKTLSSMQHWCDRTRWRWLLSLLIVLGLELGHASFASATPTPQWSCDGEPLSIQFTSGAVDLRGLPSGVPNTAGNTAPGDGVLIQWRGQTLQLPRTNNAGTPSYTDGRWWWRALDPEQPEWKERRGKIISYTCTALEVEP